MPPSIAQSFADAARTYAELAADASIQSSLEAVGEQMREERRGVRRERGIESGEMVEVNVRLRPKTPVEIGVDGWML